MNIGRSVNYSERVGLIAIKHLAYTKRFGHPPPPVCNMGFYAWLSNVDLALYIDKPNLLFISRAYRKLGDESDEYADTWAFIDRRIANVMKFEVAKAKMRKNPLAKFLMAGPSRILEHIKAPNGKAQTEFPGYVAPKG